MQWGAALADAGMSVYENAALPEVYWNKSDAKYADYPLHTPPLFSGVADGVIDEITSIPQLVKLGVEVTTDKQKAKALWSSVKKINFTSIKNAAEGALKNKVAKYTNSASHITYHELGKDGVQVASILYGGFVTKGKKLEEAVEETGETIGDKGGKNIPDDDNFDNGGGKPDGEGKPGGSGGSGKPDDDGVGDEITTPLLNSGEDFTVLANARKLSGTVLGNGKEIPGKWLRGTNMNAGLFPKSIADKLKEGLLLFFYPENFNSKLSLTNRYITNCSL